jgi:DHA1 family inner membrane transport protein
MSKEKLMLLTLAALQFTHIMDFMIMMPLGEQLMRLFQIGPKEFSIIVSAYTISAGISGFLAAFFIDKFDRKTVLLFMYLGFTIGTFACALAPNYEMLVLARIFTGIFGGTMGALSLAIVGDLIPVERRASAMGIIMSSFSLASIAGVPFGLFLANMYSWHAPFIFIGVLGIILFFVAKMNIPSVKGHLAPDAIRTSPMLVITGLLTDRNQQTSLLFMILLILGQFAIIPFITPFMIHNVGFSPNQIPFIYLVGGSLTFFSAPLIGKLADKHGRKRVFTIAAVLSIIPLYLITNLPPIPVIVALLVSGMFFILISGRMIPAQALMTSIVKPENRGSFMSLNSSVQQLGAGIASYIAGNIVYTDALGKIQNYQYVGYIGIALTFVALSLSMKIKLSEGS